MAEVVSIGPREPEEIDSFRSSAAELAALLRKGGNLSLDSGSRRADQASVAIPESLAGSLADLIELVAADRPVTLLPPGARLTEEEAAALLNVEPIHLRGLLESKAIAFEESGGQRFIRVEELLAFKEASDARRRQALDELAREGQRLGLE